MHVAKSGLSLTERELEVLRLKTRRLTNAEIGEQLFISLTTVKWHVRQIYNKLGVKNRAEAIEIATNLGILDQNQKGLEQLSGKLPVSLTPFFGRESELKTLLNLISNPEVKLVTIIGPGGIGKTRLALETARNQTDNFKQGVWFISLTKLLTADEIIPAIGQVLNISFLDGGDSTQQFFDYLRNKSLFLIIDNFEHVLAGANLVSEMLMNAPQIKVLVTSREPLNLYEEQLIPLDGLSYSPELVTIKDAAVQLFLHRARRLRPDFKLEDADKVHLTTICRQVEGLPLGLELAAAWVDVLSLAEISSGMENSLDLLETDTRNISSRHRSLRAVFDTSWQRLSEDERRLFAQMSIFRGGFTRPAAHKICASELSHTNFHRLLASLTRQSFLNHDLENGRCQIHGLMRQYGAEKLAENEDLATAVRNQHAVYYCNYHQQLGEDLKSSRQVEAWQAIEADFENGRLAWNWAIKRQQLELLQKIILLWDDFLMSWRIRFQEADRLYKDLVETVADNESNLGRQLLIQGLLCWARAKAQAGKKEEAGKLRDQAEALFTKPPISEIENWPGKSFVLWRLSWHINPPDPEQSMELLQEGIKVARRLDDRWREGTCLYSAGHLASVQGNLEEGQKLLEESLALSRLLGDNMGCSNALSSLSINALEKNHFAKAASLANEALSLNEKLGSINGISFNLESLGYAYLFNGQYALAIKALRDKLQICEDYGIHSQIVWTNYQLSHANLHAGQYERAITWAELSLSKANGAGFELVRAHALTMLGNCALVRNEPDEALHFFGQCDTYMRKNARPFSLKWYLGFYSVMQIFNGHLDSARQNINEALAVQADEYFTIIAAISLLCWAEKRWEQAVELFACACQFPYVGKSQWYADTVGKMIKQANAALPADIVAAAKQRGEELDGRDIIPVLLADLKRY